MLSIDVSTHRMPFYYKAPWLPMYCYPLMLVHILPMPVSYLCWWWWRCQWVDQFFRSSRTHRWDGRKKTLKVPKTTTTNDKLPTFLSLSIFLLLFVIYLSLSLIYTVSPSYNTHNLSPSLIHSPIDTISLSFSHSHSIASSFSLLYSNQIIFFLWNLLYVWSVIKNNLFCYFHLFSFRVNNRYSLAAVL